jgi:hypothetical protein
LTSEGRGQRAGKGFGFSPFLIAFNDQFSLARRGGLRGFARHCIQLLTVDLLTPSNLLLLNAPLFISLRDYEGIVPHGGRRGDLASLFARSTKSRRT